MKYPRTIYEMSEDDLKELLDACKPTPVMYLTGGIPIGRTPQENANDAWEKLGRKMGFDHMTVRPIEGKEMRFFTAIPSETEEQRDERVKREAEEKREKRMAELAKIIREAQEELAILYDSLP